MTDAETVQSGGRIRLNAEWRKHRGLLSEKYGAWGDRYPATGDEGTVTAHTPGERLWVHFASDLVSLPVHYDECVVV